MRIALLTLDFPPTVGGVQQYLGEVARRLTQWHEVTVVTPVRDAGDDRVDRFVIPPSVIAFTRTLVRLQPDRVLVGHAHPRLLLPAALYGKYATIVYGNDYLAAQSRWHRFFFNRLLRRSSPLITASKASADRLLKLRVPQPRIVYPGTNPDRFRPRCAPLPFPPVLLTVGRLVPRKGIDLVLRALPSLLGTHPELKYHIGGTGPDRERLEGLAQQLKVNHAVEFLGFVPNAQLPEIYREAHIFVMPVREEKSRHSLEGFGIVYLEAAASGLPTVAGRSGGAVEAVRDGETGFLVHSDNVEALSTVLRRLIDNPEQRRRMGKAGRRWVEEVMNWDRAARQMLEILEP